MAAPAKGKAGATSRGKDEAIAPDVERFDVIFFRKARGPATGKVLARGAHGVTVEHEGQRHKVRWADVHGHKIKVAPSVRVVEQGEDGLIVEDSAGQRRFVRDPLNPPATDLGKSFSPTVLFFGSRDDLLKAAGAPPRPGLTAKKIVDKRGKETTVWVHAGDEVRYPHPHGGHETSGTVVGQPGADGAHVDNHHTGEQHKVLHADMKPDAGGAGGGAGGGKPPSGGDGGDGPRRIRLSPLGHPVGEEPDGLADLEAKNDAGSAKAGLHGVYSGEEYASLPAKSRMAHKTWKEVEAKQDEAQRQLIDVLRKAAKAAGAKQVKRFDDEIDQDGPIWGVGPPKTEESALKKAAKKGWEKDDFSKLGDAVRGSMGFDTIDELFRGVDALKKAGLKIAAQPDNKFISATPAGYRDINLNIELPNGVIGELQLHLKPILKAKRTGHHDYDVTRDIEKKFAQEGVISPEEHDLWHKHMIKQRQLYGGAFRKALRGTPGEHKSSTGGVG